MSESEQTITINDTNTIEDEIRSKKNVFEMMQNKIINDVENIDDDNEGDDDDNEGDDNENDDVNEDDDNEGDDNENDDVNEDDDDDEGDDDEGDDEGDDDEGDDKKTKQNSKDLVENDIDYIDDVDDDDVSNIDDMSSSDDEEYDSIITQNVRKEFVELYHPELKDIGNTEINALSRIVRDKNGNIIDPLHTTLPFVSKFEKTRIIGIRAAQLDNGAEPLVDVHENELDTLNIAEQEFSKKILPFIISRPLPDGRIEFWKLSDLEFIE